MKVQSRKNSIGIELGNHRPYHLSNWWGRILCYDLQESKKRACSSNRVDQLAAMHCTLHSCIYTLSQPFQSLLMTVIASVSHLNIVRAGGRYWAPRQHDKRFISQVATNFCEGSQGCTTVRFRCLQR